MESQNVKLIKLNIRLFLFNMLDTISMLIIYKDMLDTNNQLHYRIITVIHVFKFK